MGSIFAQLGRAKVVIFSCFIALGVWLAFTLPRLVLGLQPWYRIPVVRGPLFDTPMYLIWLNQLKAGIEFGGNLGWYSHILRFFDTLSFHQFSVAELYVVLIVFSLILTAWVMWKALLVLTKQKETSVLIAASWWSLTMLHMGWRPAAYSWYVPFGITSIALGLYAIQTWSGWKRYVALGGAVLLSSLYPWFLIPAIFVAGTVLVHDISKRSRNGVLAGLWFLAVVVAIIGAIIILMSFEMLHVEALVDTFARYGFGWTNLPFVTTAVLAPVLWIAVCAFLWPPESRAEKSRVSLVWMWLIVLFCFELSPFMGFVFQNDHFRTSVNILSWISFAFCAAYEPEDGGSDATKKYGRWLLIWWTVTASAAFMSVWKAVEFLIHGQDLSLVQAGFWLPLVGALLLLKYPHKKTAVLRATLALCVFLGIVGGIGVIRREFADVNLLKQKQVWQESIPSLVGVHESICTDPVSADVVASAVPRSVFPSVTYRFRTESEQEQMDSLVSYAKFFDAQIDPEQWERMEFLVRQDRYLPCAHAKWFEAIAGRFGMSQASMDRVSGCPRVQMERDIARIREAGKTKTQPDRAVCKWILVTPGLESRWSMPASAEKYDLNKGGVLIKVFQP